ncbi:hypothetical protein FB451DRAFT_1184345 [Mycena latifolia]|nr:hypothetical protein FB451DRAFT_1184345 [Mycena latifolia]
MNLIATITILLPLIASAATIGDPSSDNATITARSQGHWSMTTWTQAGCSGTGRTATGENNSGCRAGGGQSFQFTANGGTEDVDWVVETFETTGCGGAVANHDGDGTCVTVAFASWQVSAN